MKNIKVSLKLIIGFMIVVALMVGLTVYAIVQMYKIENNYSVSISGPLSVREAVRDFQVNFRELRISMLAIVAYTEKDLEQCESQYESGVASYDKALAALKNAEDAITSNPIMTEKDKTPRLAKIATIRDLVTQYRTILLDPMQEAMRTGDQEQTFVFMTVASDVTTKIRENADQILQTSVDTSNEYVDEAARIASQSVILMIIIAFIAAVVSIILSVYISRLISKPLKDMVGYIKQAGETGNLKFREDEWANCDRLSQNKDELGVTMKAFTNMMRKFVYYGESLNKVANKDLTISIETLGTDDTFGNSMVQMVDELNGMLSQIQNSTEQVSVGSSQVSDGAQSLASGSTEQAATLEELSASIQDIADKTKENASRTNDASKLAESIMHNAEKGNRQMEQMIAAVNEINHANQNISKVIKAIDDIAFQTNILALNASVEAARAGNAGKGFAVVADEVRNLAAKSANSAKETGTLIANSIEKAQLGTQIAGETARSLEEIVTGISESNRIITEIARSSEEQTVAVDQINIAVGGVTQVVQQNSATAEESAAASEEMSGQAQVLESLVSQFRLK